MDVRGSLAQFLRENFITDRDGAPLGEHDSLLERGVVDSTGVLELVTFIETRFSLQVEDQEIVPANLDTLDRIARFVEAKLRASRDAAA